MVGFLRAQSLLIPNIAIETNMENVEAPKKKKMSKVLIIGIIVLALIIIGLQSDSSPSQSVTQTTAPSVQSDEPKLELKAFNCEYDSNFYTISGQVKNISDTSLKNVEALGQTFTMDGQYVNSEDSLIDYNPILPGQTSPFKVMMTMNPEMKRCKVSFKFLMGGSISATRAASSN